MTDPPPPPPMLKPLRVGGMDLEPLWLEMMSILKNRMCLFMLIPFQVNRKLHRQPNLIMCSHMLPPALHLGESYSPFSLSVLPIPAFK